MIFNTWIYAAFVLVTFIIYWFGVKSYHRAYVMLIASYVFFTYHFPWHTLLIAMMTAVVYILSLYLMKYKSQLDQGRKLRWYQAPKFILVIMLVFSLSVLAYYKYLKMAIGTLNRIFQMVDVEQVYQIPSIIVPLGLSFFVFEFVHYAVDMYRGKAEKTGPLQFAVFIMYFPTLVAGPIKRYQSFNEQRKEMSGFRKHFLYEGFSRILIGLFKKVVIADQMSVYADYLLQPGTSTTWQLWLGMYAYAIKIYFDFSGYSDIAIGSARLFGYKVPENFNHPYFQKNIADFWNNWHMSLSSWIREYVYIPLGGNRGSVQFVIRNTVLAMAISGLWHGAAWHFVFWGIYHGCGLVILRLYKQWRRNKSDSNLQILPTPTTGDVMGKFPKIRGVREWISVVFTFHFVSFGWIFFYCDMRTSAKVILKMFGVVL